MDDSSRTSRRAFLAAGAASALAHNATAAGTVSQPPQPPQPQPEVEAPRMKSTTEMQSGPLRLPNPPDRRLGFAIVGLGELALGEILPAFGHCRHARPTALVSGDAAKARAVAAAYGIGAEHIYDYTNFDRIADDRAVDVVYIVLPNSLHREFTTRAALAGKHVLCEKPMATSSADCEAMIAACDAARRQLMIAYRCQYDPYHRETIRMVRSGDLGRIRLIVATNGQNQGPVDQWRHKRALAGGGSLPDVGIYCLNAARYLTGEEPTQITAQVVTDPTDPRFREVEDRICFQLRFPSGTLAIGQSYYSGHEARTCRIIGERGWMHLDSAFAYRGLELTTSQAAGTAEQTTRIRLNESNQFALEMDHMARCVVAGVRPHTPGQEGLQDMRLIEAIYRAAREGHAVDLAPVAGLDTTRGPVPA